VADGTFVGHFIEDECVSCGICTEHCPESCISEGDAVFVIDPDRCTDCHECVRACPIECIVGVQVETAPSGAG